VRSSTVVMRLRRTCDARRIARARGNGTRPFGSAPPLNTVVILGSTRAKRIGSTVGDFIVSKLEERGGHSVTVLDPRTTYDGFYMQLMEKAYFHYKAGEVIPPELEQTAAVLRGADCYIVVTPEMNHTICPGLTNLMNYFGSSIYSKKPSGIATYSAGPWGGSRCGVALRSYLSELGCLPVSATFQLPMAWRPSTFDNKGQLGTETLAARSADKMLEQLEWHARAMQAARKAESQATTETAAAPSDNPIS